MAADPRAPLQAGRSRGAVVSPRWDSRDPGSTYDVRVSRFPHGREPGWLVIIRDISAQSRAEAERTARIAAEQANLAKDAFLAKLGHELRTPLTPVLAIVSAALDQRSIPPGLRSSLEIVQRNVRLEARLIDDLLDQSLISLGRLRLRTELVDAHALLQQSVEDCAEFLREANLIARLDLSATNSRIAADPGRLQQVFWNLITNAARNSPARSHLTIRTRNIPPDALAIEFQDEGRGLKASQLDEIFEPFIQGTADGAGRRPGLGLGLSIGRWIVEAHGGTLVAESPGPGRGATFRVVLRTADLTEVATLDRPTARDATALEPAALEPEEPASLACPQRSSSSRTIPIPCAPSRCRCPCSATRFAPRTASGRLWPPPRMDGYDLIFSDLELGDGTGLDLLRSMGPGRSVPAIVPHRLRVRGRPEDVPGGGLRDAPHQADRDQAARRGDSEYHPKTINPFDVADALKALPGIPPDRGRNIGPFSRATVRGSGSSAALRGSAPDNQVGPPAVASGAADGYNADQRNYRPL